MKGSRNMIPYFESFAPKDVSEIANLSRSKGRILMTRSFNVYDLHCHVANLTMTLLYNITHVT